ncbi:hypothetical protein ABZ726_29600, partial [Streptomyces hundungensis]
MTTIDKTLDVPAQRPSGDGPGALLEVRDLHVEFHTREGVAKAVNGVNYSVNAGETLAEQTARDGGRDIFFVSNAVNELGGVATWSH